MKKLLSILIIIGFYSCSSHHIQKEEVAAEENDQKIVEAINSGVYADFADSVKNQNLQGHYQLHNLLASKCSSQYPRVTEQMALTLIARGAQPQEKNYEDYKAPLRTSLERGCSPLVHIYLNHLSAQEIASFSLDLKAADFITFTEKILDREPSAQELVLIEQGPFALDLAIQKNSELCLNEEKNCQARDHLLEELKSMKQAVAKLAFHKACVAQIEIVNTLQMMNEQVEFARATGVAKSRTYDEHVGQAQELRGWYNYYDTLFFRMTGENADLTQCYL